MIYVKVKRGMEAAASLTTIKLLSTVYPGDEQLTLLVEYPDAAGISFDSGGGVSIPKKVRRLELGPEWAYEPSPACLAALGEFGSVSMEDDSHG